MTKKFFVSLLLLSLTLTTHATVFAAEAPKLKKGEKLFDQEYDRVWDATISVIKERGFSAHPHKKWKIKKAKGRIKTPEWRYFKIWSAKPVIEKQYKDSYKIRLKKIEIEVPQPEGAKADTAAPAADGTAKTADAAPPATEAAAKPADAAAGTAPADSAAAPAEATPAPVPTITKVKISIKRKFLVHNDETRKWDKGDPNKEMAGYSVEDLFKAIEEKLANPSPQAGETKQANLNIAPPPIHRIPKP
ncbi:MAG: hypothetical protein ACE5F7_03485 [Nitrospiria bacterium]